MAADRPSAANWFADSFGEDYLALYRHRDAREAERAVAFAIRALGLGPDDVVLDLCCGGGRHLAAAARHDVHPIGLDLSAVLLAHARETGVDAPLVRADMRRLPFRSARFDAVLSFFTSFGYFSDDGDDRAVLREAARLLRPGGRMMLDFLNRDHVLAHGLGDTVEERDGQRVEQRRRFDPDRNTVDKTITITDPRRPTAAREYLESVRLYSADALHTLFERAGLRVTERFGSLDGEPYRRESTRCVIVATADHDT